MGLDAPRRAADIYDLIAERLRLGVRLVVLDDAENLTRSCLEMVLEYKKQDEPRGRGVAFVLGSGKRRLLQRIDDADCDGTLISQVEYYAPNCDPTRRMKEIYAFVEELSREFKAPPLVPFPDGQDSR